MSDISRLKRIMVVDDDPDLQDIIRLGLETGGAFTVKACYSAGQALEEITGFQPGLVILDMLLPDMKGTQLLEELQKVPHTAPVPVIFLTSKIHPRQVEEYKELGVIGVINKPVNPLSLAQRVREIWEKKRSATAP